jgi:lipopolysaccharide export system protein LptA
MIAAALILVLAAIAPAASSDKPATEATITSDELEIKNSGAEAVFRGQVVLKQDPYVLTADRMTQNRASGVVEARGRVLGTWVSETGEKLIAEGRSARYTPSTKVTELWGNPKLTRWETAKDTAPVVITAVRFVASQSEGTVWAREKVVLTRGENVRVRADQAKLSQDSETVDFWGEHRVNVYWRDPRGIADFESDRGWVSLSPRRARLLDRVRGKVTLL